MSLYSTLACWIVCLAFISLSLLVLSLEEKAESARCVFAKVSVCTLWSQRGQKQTVQPSGQMLLTESSAHRGADVPVKTRVIKANANVDTEGV